MQKLLAGDTRQLEFFGGVQGLCAGVGALIDSEWVGVVEVFSYRDYFITSLVIAALQIIAVLSSRMKWRHNTNILSAAIFIWISILILQHPNGNLLGVGGYAVLGSGCIYCSIHTRLKLINHHGQNN